VDKATVVLVHGAVERASGFSPVVERLGEFEVITYDRRGHGERWREGTSSLNEDSAELIELIGERTVTAVGHSIGGLVVMGAASQRPELFGSIGLYETAVPWADWWSEADRATMLEETERNFALASETATPEGERLEVAWRCCRRQVLDAFGGPFRWQDITVPVVTGRGAESLGPSARDASLVSEHFGGKAVLLAASGHRAHRTNSTAFADFVRQCVAARSVRPNDSK